MAHRNCEIKRRILQQTVSAPSAIFTRCAYAQGRVKRLSPSIYMFCANRGSGPSMDCLAQTVDRALSGQTVDRLRKAWIKLAQSVDVGQTVDSYC